MPGITGKRNVDFLEAGTSTAVGIVTFHDRTIYELGRICIQSGGKYPDLETWVQHLTSRGKVVKTYYYAEQVGRQGLSGYLWLYYVSAQRSERTNWHTWR
jgi:hypothetical protein